MTKRRNKQTESYWKDGLSVSETKFSVLILLLVIFSLYSLYDHYTNGDIAMSLIELIKVFIYAVVGINVANKLGDSYVASKENKDDKKDKDYIV